MNTSALVSVIMPAYNCEKYINQAIDSILNQTYTNFELLIADDASTDKTKSLIDEYTDARIKRFHNKINLGYLKTSNLLFEKCTGDFITFQDADDFADKNRIELLLSFLANRKDYACVGSNIVKLDTQSKELYRSNYPVGDNEIRVGFEEFKVVFTGSALMMRKEVLNVAGFYNDYFDRIGSEDTYMFSLILDHFKVANLKEPLYYYRTNPTSVGASHKNPKAAIGHNLIILMYKRRLRGLVDFIKIKKWNIADKYAKFLLDISLIKISKTKALMSFTLNFIKYPAIGFQMSRMFFSNLKA